MTTKPNRETPAPVGAPSSAQNDENASRCSVNETQQPTRSDDASADAEQERLRKLYLQQQQRLSCPGCGESPFLG